MVAYKKPQQRKKEESERLRGQGDQVKSIGFRFERWKDVRFRKERGRQTYQRMIMALFTSLLNFFKNWS